MLVGPNGYRYFPSSYNTKQDADIILTLQMVAIVVRSWDREMSGSKAMQPHAHNTQSLVEQDYAGNTLLSDISYSAVP